MTSKVPAQAVAVDLGASTGRVVRGEVGPDTLQAQEVHRFDNVPVRAGGHLRWDLAALWGGVLTGLRAALLGWPADPGPISVGFDSWAVDYGLIDHRGRLLADPVHYRDERTDGVLDRVRRSIGARRMYDVTGLHSLPFNTIYQLACEDPALLDRAEKMLMVPDLLVHRLTGVAAGERTNASTTQLYDVHRQDWSAELAHGAGIDPGLLPPLRDPGSVVGPLLTDARQAVGGDGHLQVCAVASHDTASAVLAVPAENDRFAYISCGTWSLVGVELDHPVLSSAAMQADFTNESGVEGTVRLLRNEMGLWPLQESLRHWHREGTDDDLATLLRAAAAEPAGRSLVDTRSPALLTPGDLPARIRALCMDRGDPVPETQAAVVRCILDSLARGHADAISCAVRLSGRSVDVVHMVGGGARNILLAQLTADAVGLPVVTGPYEATALGNLLVQARTAGVIGDRWEARSLVRRTQQSVRYEPGRPVNVR